MAIEVRPLRETDNRATFRSGDPDLDHFFARYAGQNQFRHHTGTTYVAVEADRTAPRYRRRFTARWSRLAQKHLS